jgi:hypothetical protein
MAGAQLRKPIITSFNMDAKKWADCQTIESVTGAVKSQVNFLRVKIRYLTGSTFKIISLLPSIANIYLLAV